MVRPLKNKREFLLAFSKYRIALPYNLNMVLAERAVLFDDFRDYITENCCKGKNNQLTTQEFGTLKNGGTNHMCIQLRNVGEGNRQLFVDIESFRENTKLRVVDHPQNGNQIYTAYIPLRNKKHSRHRKHGSTRRRVTGAPDPMVLYKWMFGLTVTVLISTLTTTWEDWSFIHRHLY